MTDNLYIFEEGRTITVSAFSGPQDVCPKDFEIQGKDKYLRVHVKNQDFQVILFEVLLEVNGYSFGARNSTPLVSVQYSRSVTGLT